MYGLFKMHFFGLMRRQTYELTPFYDTCTANALENVLVDVHLQLCNNGTNAYFIGKLHNFSKNIGSFFQMPPFGTVPAFQIGTFLIKLTRCSFDTSRNARSIH
jgi:hypothetical protein